MAVAIGVGLVVGYGVYEAVKASIPTIPVVPTKVQIKEILNPDYNVPVVYGEQRLEGDIIFYNTTGTNNKFLDIIVLVAEGEIEGFERVYMDDGALPIWDAGAGNTFATDTEIAATHPLYGTQIASGTLAIGKNYPAQPGTFVFSKTIFGVNGYTTTGHANLDALVTHLNGSADSRVNVATYSNVDGKLHIVYDTAGTVGNSFEVYFSCYMGRGTDAYGNVRLSGGTDIEYGKAYFYNGTDTQTANAQLVAAYPAVGVPGDADYETGWTTNHKLSGFAYAYIRLENNLDLFSGSIPKFSFELKGRKVYDPRTATTIYSNNPAVCLRDYLLNTRFGKALDSSVLSNQSVIDAANDCDTSKSGTDVTGSPITYNTYEIGAVVDTSKPVKDNVAYFLQSMNATLPYFDGQYYIKVLKAGNPVVTFTENNIVGQISLSSSTKRDRTNKVIITFPDKDRHFKKGDAPIDFSNNTDAATYYAEDNNQILEKRIEAPYINYYPRALDLAELTMKMSRKGISASFTTTMEALKATTGDIVGITYDIFGWTNKEFRLEKIVSRLDGLCDVVCSEHDDALYTLSDKQEQAGSFDTNVPDPREVAKPTIDTVYSDTTTVIVGADGVVHPRIYVAWTNNDVYPYKHFVYLKKSTDSTFTEVAQISKDDALAFYIPNVEWGTQYDIGVATQNGIGYTSVAYVMSYTVPNPQSGANYNFPDVKGLELIGEGTNAGQGNVTDFTGKDIKLQWRLSSNNVTFEFGSAASEAMGGTGGVLPFSLTGYRIEVYHPTDTIPRQEYFTTSPNFIYGLDKNIEDGSGIPSRTVTFKIYAVGQVIGYNVTGESDIPAVLTVTNAAPSLPNNVTTAVGFQTITLTYDRPAIADWSGIIVWMDTTTGFTPSATNLVYNGTDNKIVLSGLTTGSTYYLKYAMIDTFVPYNQTDITNLTVSAELSLTTDTAVTSSEIQSLIADKIAAGTLGEAVTLGGVFVASGTEAVLNGTGPALGTYRLEMGPVAHTGATYILNYYNGYDDADVSYVSQFSIDDSGNAIFGGTLSAASGTFSGDLSASGGTFTGTLSAVDGTFDTLTVNTNGYIRGGQTGYDTGTGFWLGDVSGTKKFSIGNSSANKLTWNGSSLDLVGNISASTITGSNFNAGTVRSASVVTTGAFLSVATTGGETTIYLTNTDDFATSGSGQISDSTNNSDAFSWTGKTSTTLTGCSGILAHTVNAVVTPGTKTMYFSESLNELEFYGDRGDGTVEELATIGVKQVGTDYVVGQFGSYNSGSSRVGVQGTSYSSTGVSGYSVTGYGMYAQAVNGTALACFSSNGVGLSIVSNSTTVGSFHILPKVDTTDPSAGQKGQFYVRSDGVLRFHNGTSWKTVTVV